MRNILNSRTTGRINVNDDETGSTTSYRFYAEKWLCSVMLQANVLFPPYCGLPLARKCTLSHSVHVQSNSLPFSFHILTSIILIT